jgi:protein-disulfide isomerase
MASRRVDKQAARRRRLETERALATQARRTRRLQILGAMVTAGIVIVVVAVLITGSGAHERAVSNPRSTAARSIAAHVDQLLHDIPEQGATLGRANAPVTITEFGDLECPYCAQFASGSQAELIARDVRAGMVKLVYKSLETATGGGPDAGLWPLQQAAAYAAGSQNRAWYYIELFYREQGPEDSGYATTPFLESIARQTPGLNYHRWNTDRFAPSFAQEVLTDESQARQSGVTGTPTVIATGPNKRTRPINSAEITYSQLQAIIRSVD